MKSMKPESTGKEEYNILSAIDEIVTSAGNGDFQIVGDDDNNDDSYGIAMRQIESILKYDSKVTPPDGVELFDILSERVYDMRRFLTNMFGESVYIIKLDVDHVYSHLDETQLDMYTSGFHHGGVPKNKGLYFNMKSDEGLECSYKWKSITKDMSEILNNILFWIKFGEKTGTNISEYIYDLPQDSQVLLNLIIENKDKFLNI